MMRLPRHFQTFLLVPWMFVLLAPAPSPVVAEGARPEDHRGPNHCGICCALRGGACGDRFEIPPYAIAHSCPSPAHSCPGPGERDGSWEASARGAVWPVDGPGAQRAGTIPSYVPPPTGSASLPESAVPSYMPQASRPDAESGPALLTSPTGIPVVSGGDAPVSGVIAPQTLATPEQAQFARSPGDCVLYTGPFILERVPVLAEHKFPRYFACSMRVIPKLRLYPFLAFNVYVPHEGNRVLLATNFVFNSLPVTESGLVDVGAGQGLGYLEQHVEGGVEKYMILRLRDGTVKVTRLDAEGRGVYSVYSISGRPWAMFAHRYVTVEQPLRPTILPDEWSHPREGPHLRRLLRGSEAQTYSGFWTIPQGEQVAGWGEISLKSEARVLSAADPLGTRTAPPLEVGHFAVLFEEGLTYTEPAYDPPRRSTMPLPYSSPADESRSLFSRFSP